MHANPHKQTHTFACAYMDSGGPINPDMHAETLCCFARNLLAVLHVRSLRACRWFRVAGYCSMPGIMWGIMQDTTASRTRLDCAQRSLHQLKTLFEAEFCGFGVVDTADTG